MQELLVCEVYQRNCPEAYSVSLGTEWTLAVETGHTAGTRGLANYRERVQRACTALQPATP
jgi:hypothetical protein